jgi:immunity protein 35 of polymorphic toxin system
MKDPQPNPGGIITPERALAIARESIAHLAPGIEFVVLEEQTIEKDYGWIFQFTTRRYRETHDPGALVPGTGPLVVERDSGATAFLATSVCPEKAIEEYERRRRR